LNKRKKIPLPRWERPGEGEIRTLPLTLTLSHKGRENFVTTKIK
jgi:hypothetical protein